MIGLSPNPKLLTLVLMVLYAVGLSHAAEWSKNNGSNPGEGTKESKGNVTDLEVESNDASAIKEVGTDKTGSSGTTLGDLFSKNSDMLNRAMYVTIAVTGILLLYFGIRFIRSRKRRKVKRYGLLTNSSKNVEMAPLASDSDEDMTVFDARQNTMQ